MDQDHCPRCGREITDGDVEGVELPTGQRWCTDHVVSPTVIVELCVQVADLLDAERVLQDRCDRLESMIEDGDARVDRLSNDLEAYQNARY